MGNETMLLSRLGDDLKSPGYVLLVMRRHLGKLRFGMGSGSNSSKMLAAAEAAYHAREIDKADSLCRQLLSAQPDCGPALLMLATIALERGDPNSALLHAEKAAAHGSNADAYHCLGHCHAICGNLEEAVRSYQQAIRLKPSSGALHRELGSLLWRLGRSEESESALRRAVSLEPTADSSLVALGHLLIDRGNPEEAVRFLKRAIKLNTPIGEAYALLGIALGEVNSPEETEPLFRRAFSLGHESSAAYAGLGFRFLRLGKFDEAVESFLKAISMNPSQGAAYGGIAKAKKFGPQDRPLVEQMSSLAANHDLTDSEKIHLHYALGKAFDDLGEFSDAAKQFQMANRLAKAASGKTFDLTTQAARIDRTIELFTKDFLGANRRTGGDLDRPIFIVGMMRSGTTLVDQILSSHPDVTSGGELPFWTANARCSPEDPDERFERSNIERLAIEYLGLLRNLGGPSPRVTDKMPANFLVLGAIHLAFPSSPIIHCRRNPVDTCWSIYTTPFRKSADYAHDPENIVAYYREYQRLMEHWRTVLPAARFLEVDYEELVSDPEGVTRHIVSFCGLEWNDRCLAHEQNARAVDTASVWQSRQPIYKSSVERWRNYESWLGAFRELG